MVQNGLIQAVRRRLLIVLVAGTVLLSESSWVATLQTEPDAAQGDAAEMRQALVSNLAHHVIPPSLRRLEEASRALSERAADLCASARPATLQAARQAWRDTVAAWKQIELLRYATVSGLRFGNELDFWPTRPRLIEKALKSSEPITADYVANLGVANKGLPALEYLLFDPARENAELVADLDGGSRRCAYLHALAAEIHRQAQRLISAWDPEHFVFIAEGERPPYQTDEMIVGYVINTMAAIMNVIRRRLQLQPAGYALPEKTEAWRSGNSVDNLVNNLQGFDALFRGQGRHSDATGFDDYLAAIGKSDLAGKILTRTRMTIEAVRAIPAPLHKAAQEQPETVQRAEEQLHVLRDLVSRDLAEALGVMIGFNAADGD